MRVLPAMAFVVAAVTGCGAAGAGGEHACTAMASPSGISVDIAPKFAERVADTAHVRACWAGSCREREVELRADTTVASTTCTSEKPSGVCGARMKPTGGKSGFAHFPGIPTAPVRTMLVLQGTDGQPVVDTTLRVRPEETYPNGPQCGASGNQAGLTVGPGGEVRQE